MSRLKSVIDNNPHKNEEHSDYSDYSDYSDQDYSDQDYSDEDYTDEDYYLVDEDYELRNEDILGLKNKHLVEQIDTYKPQHPKLHSHNENNHFQYAEPGLSGLLARVKRISQKKSGHKRWGKLKSLSAIGVGHKEEDENAEEMETSDGDNKKTRARKAWRRARYSMKKRKNKLKISKMTKETLLQLTNPHTNTQVQKLQKLGIYIVGQPNDKLGQLRAKYVAVLLHCRIKKARLPMQHNASLRELREYIFEKILRRKLLEAIKSDRKKQKFKKFVGKAASKKNFLKKMRSGLNI